MGLHQFHGHGRHRVGPVIRQHAPSLSTIFQLSVVVPVVAILAVFTVFANRPNSASSTVRNAAAATAPDLNCSLVVPQDPLSAAGLAAPYLLTATNPANGPCNENNANQSAFVEVGILNPATGAVSVYRPLVIDRGTLPAAAPVVPTLPANAVIGIWFGFNGANLTLQGPNNSPGQGNCVDGTQGSPFGQFAYCNAPALFAAANKAIGAGQLAVPALGTAKDGLPCPTTRDFGIVDQDQSDNVVTSYLVQGGKTAQNNATNAAALAAANPILNPSDNLLLANFVDPALGCTPFMAPDLTNGGKPVPSLALNELLAAAHQAAPVALVPTNDPMTMIGNTPSQDKTNLYRAGVDQPALNPATDTPTAYCQNMVTIGARRIQLDENLTTNAPSPDPAMANTLFTFLADRLNQSFTNLGCMNLLHQNNPVTVTKDGNGVVTGAAFANPVAPATP